MREARHFDTGSTQIKPRNADRNAKWNGVLLLRISEDREFGNLAAVRERGAARQRERAERQRERG